MYPMFMAGRKESIRCRVRRGVQKGVGRAPGHPSPFSANADTSRKTHPALAKPRPLPFTPARSTAMALIVQKYGGTSVGTLDRIRNVAARMKRTRDDGNQVVAVVSAMSGVTDKPHRAWPRSSAQNPPRARDGRAARHRRAAVDRAASPWPSTTSASTPSRSPAARPASSPPAPTPAAASSTSTPRCMQRLPRRRQDPRRRRLPGRHPGRHDPHPRPRRLRPHRHRHRRRPQGRCLPDPHRRRRRLHLRPADRPQRPQAARNLLRRNAGNGLVRLQGHAVALGRVRQEIRRRLRSPLLPQRQPRNPRARRTSQHGKRRHPRRLDRALPSPRHHHRHPRRARHVRHASSAPSPMRRSTST